MDIGIYKNYADVIFNQRFLVNVPVLATYSEEEMDILGVPMHIENDETKFKAEFDMTTAMITINDMINIYNNGFPIRLLNNDDVLYIYNVIQNHLLAWKNRGVNSLNKVYLDIDDDLITLDKFANEIFGLHKIDIVNSNMIVKPTFENSLFDILMSPTTPRKNLNVINYDEVTRTELAPKKIRSEKYDLNSLLN